ncbi:MAG: cytidine deaminase [Anaerolineae bacterium]|jgi:cytidine deaminase|nr:cytidine deaminase [Anaerolineae bacterium]
MTLDRKWIEAAIQAAQHAYAPYSSYQVGAALVTLDGTVFTGCNVENAAYPMCICAERTALVKAVSEGQRQFGVLVVATRDGGSPCGMCRQMLYEFAPELEVVIVDFTGHVHHQIALNQLLTLGFNAASLK